MHHSWPVLTWSGNAAWCRKCRCVPKTCMHWCRWSQAGVGQTTDVRLKNWSLQWHGLQWRYWRSRSRAWCRQCWILRNKVMRSNLANRITIIQSSKVQYPIMSRGGILRPRDKSRLWELWNMCWVKTLIAFDINPLLCHGSNLLEGEVQNDSCWEGNPCKTKLTTRIRRIKWANETAET